MEKTKTKRPASPHQKPVAAEFSHPLAPVMEAMAAVLKNTARRIDIAVALDGAEYRVVCYRQLDNVVRCEFKLKSN